MNVSTNSSVHKLLLLAAVVFVLLSSLLVSSPSYSQVDTFEFDTEAQQKRFRTLSDELRCPMCQNASLSGSTGGVAEDLRREIHRMIMEGMSDSEIIQFMFERYGDFILFRPRLTAGTALLWFGPLLFLLFGAAIAFGIWRRARQYNVSEVQLDQAQQDRLQQLLGDKT